MGYFRFISKPFKRAAFRHSKLIIENGIKIVYAKYCQKFITKFNKNSIPVQGLEEYQTELLRKLEKEKGISHGKTREYWFMRGPRLFLTVFVGISLNICCSQIIQEEPEIWVSISSGLVWLSLSAYMLYQRLPDSILSSLMRIGHDHYTSWKKNNFQKIESK